MREQDRGSFEEWARARQQQLVRTAYLVTGDHHRAEDLVQEALVGVAMRWDRLRDGNPDAWVRTVVYRANVSWWRKHRREVAVERVPVIHQLMTEASLGVAVEPMPGLIIFQCLRAVVTQ